MTLVPAGSTEPYLVTIADIGFSSNWVVTPLGAYPLAGTQVIITDMSRTERRIPTWAIVIAILGALFFLLGLFFLLVKENVTTGAVQITIHSGGTVYSTHIPVYSHATVADLYGRTNYARQLIAAAAARDSA